MSDQTCRCRPCETCGQKHYCNVNRSHPADWVRVGGCPPAHTYSPLGRDHDQNGYYCAECGTDCGVDPMDCLRGQVAQLKAERDGWILANRKAEEKAEKLRHILIGAGDAIDDLSGSHLLIAADIRAALGDR